MDEAIRTAAAAFYHARLDAEPDDADKEQEQEKEEKEAISSFIHYGQLAESAVSASDVLSVSPALKTMIENEKEVLKDRYYQANSALFIILEKLLAERGVKVKNLTAKTGFLNNAVFKFDPPPVEAEEISEGAKEISEEAPLAEAELIPDVPVAVVTPVIDVPVANEVTQQFPAAIDRTKDKDAVNVLPAKSVSTASGTTFRVGGGRTRSLLKSIRRLTKKNIRRMI